MSVGQLSKKLNPGRDQVSKEIHQRQGVNHFQCWRSGFRRRLKDFVDDNFIRFKLPNAVFLIQFNITFLFCFVVDNSKESSSKNIECSHSRGFPNRNCDRIGCFELRIPRLVMIHPRKSKTRNNYSVMMHP